MMMEFRHKENTLKFFFFKKKQKQKQKEKDIEKEKNTLNQSIIF